MLESWVGLGPNNTGEMKYGQLFYLSNLNMYRKITQAGFFFFKAVLLKNGGNTSK